MSLILALQRRSSLLYCLPSLPALLRGVLLQVFVVKVIG